MSRAGQSLTAAPSPVSAPVTQGRRPGGEQCAAGQHRGQHVEAQVAERSDQRDEQHPEVHRPVVPAAGRAVEGVGEDGIQGQHEDHEGHQVAGAGAAAGAVGEQQDPDHRGGVLVERLVQPDVEQRDELAAVVEDVAGDVPLGAARSSSRLSVRVTSQPMTMLRAPRCRSYQAPSRRSPVRGWSSTEPITPTVWRTQEWFTIPRRVSAT